MPNRNPAAIALALGLALLAGCAEAPTAPDIAPLDPQDPVEAVLAASDTARVVADSAVSDRADHRHSWVLGRLFRHSLHRIAREKGREAAEEVAAPVRRLHEEAHAALAAGDTAAAREKAVEAERIMAAVVVRVVGPGTAPKILHRVAHRIDALAHHIRRAAEAGKDVTRARRLLEVATGLHRAGREALDAGHPAEALRLGARAADLLARAARH